MLKCLRPRWTHTSFLLLVTLSSKIAHSYYVATILLCEFNKIWIFGELTIRRFIAILLSSLALLLFAGTNKASLYDGDLGETLYLQQKPISIIYHSVDGGRTWMSFDNSLPFDATVSSFVAINNEIFAATDNHGIYLITDGERAWKRIDEDLPKDVDIKCIFSRW